MQSDAGLAVRAVSVSLCMSRSDLQKAKIASTYLGAFSRSGTTQNKNNAASGLSDWEASC